MNLGEGRIPVTVWPALGTAWRLAPLLRGSAKRAQGWACHRSGYSRVIADTLILILRFPDGEVEHRSTPADLPIGALVRARGTLWRVQEHTDTGAAVLAEAEPVIDGAPPGPVVVPDPLFGDNPLTLEVLVEA